MDAATPPPPPPPSPLLAPTHLQRPVQDGASILVVIFFPLGATVPSLLHTKLRRTESVVLDVRGSHVGKGRDTRLVGHCWVKLDWDAALVALHWPGCKLVALVSNELDLL